MVISMIRNNLKKLRLNLGFSQTEMSTLLGVSLRRYIDIESGKALPNLRTAFKIARNLDTSVNDIWYETDEDLFL